MARLILPSLVLGFAIATACSTTAAAEASPPDAIAPAASAAEIETILVERAKHKQPKEPTLRFLSENRDFFRARLDDLLVSRRLERNTNARTLDARWLRYQEMMAEIRAASDSARASGTWIEQRGLLERVGDLTELEEEMDEMESLLMAQAERLEWLEEDFTGRQSTVLVVLLTGIPTLGAPSRVVVRDPDGETIRVSLPESARTSLERGGTIELVHRRVEPRAHRWQVSFEGQGWTDRTWAVDLNPERNRITFLELDTAGLDPSRPDSRVTARHWTR